MSYSEGLTWVFNHQHPNVLNDEDYVILTHPWSDGDGIATRINRLLRRSLSYMLEGKVVILKGGFRGYGCKSPNDPKGFTKYFQPFCRFDHNLEPISSVKVDGNYKSVPDNLKSKDNAWWLGVLVCYFMRPSDLLSEYMDLKIKHLGLPKDYIGLHIRRGDHPRGLRYDHDDYIKILESHILKLWEEEYADKPAFVYLATDDKDVASALSGASKPYLITTDNRGIYAHRISCVGQSASNTLIRNSTEEWTIVATLEVLSDIIILSKSKYMCGLMISQVTLLSSLMGSVNSNLLHPPFAVDYAENNSIQPDGGFIVEFSHI